MNIMASDIVPANVVRDTPYVNSCAIIATMGRISIIRNAVRSRVVNCCQLTSVKTSRAIAANQSTAIITQ